MLFVFVLVTAIKQKYFCIFIFISDFFKLQMSLMKKFKHKVIILNVYVLSFGDNTNPSYTIAFLFNGRYIFDNFTFFKTIECTGVYLRD